MQYVENILEFIRVYLEDESIDDELMVFINMAIDQASGFRDWDGLFAQETIAVTDGILTVPPRLKKPIEIFPEYSGTIPTNRFQGMTGQRTKERGFLYRHAHEPYPATDSDLLSTTITVTAGSATVSQSGAETFFDSTHVGKALFIVGSPDEHKIVSVDGTEAVVYPAVKNATGDVVARVQPAGTTRMKLISNDLSLYSGNVEFRYSAKHPRVDSANDLLLIPCPRFIAITALGYGLEKNKYSVDSDRLQRDLVEARVDEVAGDINGKSKSGCISTLFSVRGKRLNRA